MGTEFNPRISDFESTAYISPMSEEQGVQETSIEKNREEQTQGTSPFEEQDGRVQKAAQQQFSCYQASLQEREESSELEKEWEHIESTSHLVVRTIQHRFQQTLEEVQQDRQTQHLQECFKKAKERFQKELERIRSR